ncbi:hypothetical protein [Actinomadura rubrisoli]|uniref:Uncharacterized protein n=1 Tax=Actinomadura rubrisoli TaxID=2530368 RepID=A0A4R5AG80_9ACTN|nr:hypothetical protein [Actinomadura rubrisoli]TDD69022.1 hypothetical protein E1298_37865 [Actinomadura rubrisoli]
MEHEVFTVDPGPCHSRVSAWNRRKTSEEYRRIGEHTGFQSPEFATALQRLAGQERYLVQLWRD